MALNKDARGLPTPNGEDMITGPDNRSLRRGRRAAPRTDVCRPALVWLLGQDEHPMQGVILDLNPHGMKVRMLEPLPMGARLRIQMMRDEDFRVPLSQPLHAEVMRVTVQPDGFVDLGLRVHLPAIKRPEEAKPVHIDRPMPRRRTVSRMHTVDYTVGERVSRGTGKNRG